VVNGARKINELERVTVDVLLDYFSKTTPGRALTDRAKVALGTFGSIQRRRSAENQREALRLMMKREHLVPTLPTLPSPGMSLSSGESSS
jgi:hypothetical protein